VTEITRVRPGAPEWQEFSRIVGQAFAGDVPGGHDPITENYLMHSNARAVATGSVTYSGDYGFLRNIAVAPEMRGKGFGHRMLDGLEARIASRFRIACLMTEDANIEFYRKAGYRLDASGPNRDGQFFMSKNLRPAARAEAGP
jgi:GNAT superfamily N-acetyltransferase